MSRAWVWTLVSVLVLAGSLAGAQPPGKVWQVGLFHVGLDHVPPSLDPLREELRRLGYEPGKNVHLDWRNLPDEDAARETAREFVRNRVDLIVAFENQTVRAAKAATTEIPVVFLHVDDPVANGFVKSLARPGGNLTGLVTYAVSQAKQIELFRELVPTLRRLLVLVDPDEPTMPRILADVRSAAAVLQLRLQEREARKPPDLERVFAALKPGEVDGVYVASQRLRANHSALLIELASTRRLPLASHRKEWVERGALFSYATDVAGLGRVAARYVDRILKGAKPGDLPVEQAAKFELVINLKAARALGLTIPQSVLLRADALVQ